MVKIKLEAQTKRDVPGIVSLVLGLGLHDAVAQSACSDRLPHKRFSLRGHAEDLEVHRKHYLEKKQVSTTFCSSAVKEMVRAEVRGRTDG